MKLLGSFHTIFEKLHTFHISLHKRMLTANGLLLKNKTDTQKIFRNVTQLHEKIDS